MFIWRFTPTCVGTMSRRREHGGGGRFTPTCVGTIRVRRSRRPGSPVHPHVRGENFVVIAWRSWLSGSPPRAWGQSNLPLWPPGPHRFTPTCVGTMTENSHPAHSARGSPPRAWGQ